MNLWGARPLDTVTITESALVPAGTQVLTNGGKAVYVGAPIGCHNFAVCGGTPFADFAETLQIGEPGEPHRRIYAPVREVSGW